MFHFTAQPVLVLLSLLLLLLLSCSSVSSLRDFTTPHALPAHAVPGEYIVKFHKDAHHHFNRLKTTFEDDFHPDLAFMHHEHSDYMAMYGALDDMQLSRAKALEGVEFVQHNFQYTTQFDTSQSAKSHSRVKAEQSDDDDDGNILDGPGESEVARSWGLDRADQQFLPLNGVYRFLTNGSSVAAFVLDTGVNKRHPDWRPNQARFVADCSKEQKNICKPNVIDANDPNGHGTHVAGTIASPTYGLAKATTILDIRVLSEDGTGFTPGIVNAIEYAMGYAKANRDDGMRYVINLSLGSGLDPSLNRKIEDAWDDNIVVVAAAGNEAHNACNSSPAGANGVVAVGASTIGDSVATYSNFGTCVDLFAPGDSIVSLNTNFEESGKLTLINSGTSMASPHVAGAAALVLDLFPEYTPEEVEDALSDSSKQIVAHSIPDTTRKLLYTFDESLEPDHKLVTYQLVLLCSGGVLALAFLVAMWYCVCQPKHLARRRPTPKFYHRFDDESAAGIGGGGGHRGSYEPPHPPPSYRSDRNLLSPGKSPF